MSACYSLTIRLLLLLILWSGIFLSVQAQTDTIFVKDSLLNINIHEVKVIAKENCSAATSSVIRREAIQHVQPFALADLMQLLPGATTPKVSFNTPRYLSIRNSNALGVGLSIDGVKLSTNADLQQLVDGQRFSGSSNGETGVDTRELSTDNIESVEVIRGIPSARYGDITSGMVVVQTRKNARPYSVNIRITPEIKSIHAGKGWQINDKNILNLSTGYTRSYNPNSPQTTYNLVSFQTSYIGHFKRRNPLSIESSISGDISSNPDLYNNSQGEYSKMGRQSFRFLFSGEWTPNKKILSSINWKFSTQYAHSLSQINRHISTLYSIGTNATEEKEQEGFFIPPQYWNYDRIESCPLTFSGGLSTTTRKSGDHWKSISTLGVEWNNEGNNGSGKQSEIRDPNLPTQARYDFRDIPFMHQYALYAEENFQTGRLNIEAGVRLAGVSVQGGSFRPIAEPRLNLRYFVFRDEHHRFVQLRGGIGLLRKMPTLAYLFREPQYKNYTSYRYRDEESGNQLAIVTTAVSQTTGIKDLKLPQNLKIEIGLSATTAGFSIDITGFYERLSHGFTTRQLVRPFSYRNYTTDNSQGLSPEYRNGEVYVNGQATGYTSDTTFISSTQSGNNLYESKGGIEFILRSGYIPLLSTTFVFDGAWIIKQSEERGLSARYKLQSSGNKSYPMCGIYDNEASRTTQQQLNTTLRAVTEIPALRLTTTIALQTTWLDQSQEKINSRAQSRYYMKDETGNRIYDHVANDAQRIKYIDPVFYLDTQGELHPFTPEMANNPTYGKMVEQFFSRKFLKDSYSPYFMLNLRISKEIGKHLSLSFYANNLAKMNPSRYQASFDGYSPMNPPAFFGAELQITL